MPTLPLHLWCIGKYSWLTCTIMPTQLKSITAPPLYERFGLACSVESWISFHQGTSRPPQSGRETPGWSHTNTVARWTLYHLRRNSHRHCCCLVLEQHRFMRGFSSRSCGCTEGREIRRNCCPVSFCSLAFGTFGPVNQAGCDFLSSLGHRLSLVSDDPRSYLPIYFNVFPLLFSASTLFVSATHSGNLAAQFFGLPICT
jgi:hypothetical protein